MIEQCSGMSTYPEQRDNGNVIEYEPKGLHGGYSRRLIVNG
jgi:hypothetical protein